MSSIVLFDQDDVTVLLHNLQFDKEIDGVRATIEIQNRQSNSVNVELVDLWDGERFYDDYGHTLCSVLAGQTKKADYLEINSVYEDDSILEFYNGYLPAFSFRVALYTRDENERFLECYSKGNKVVVSKFSMDGVTVMSDDCFKIKSNSEMISAASECYIPFEINKSDPQKAQMIQSFNDELVGRINNFQIMASREVLIAKYGEIGKPRFYDIENMCIYNLGTSTFSHCCPTDIAFSEMPLQEIEEIQKRLGATEAQKCYYAYELVLREELEHLCNSKQLIAGWSHIDIDTNLANTPRRYWESIRRQFERIYVHQSLNNPARDYFGLQVTVHVPRQLLPASVMKPLLDGIVCAFHGRDGIDDVMQTLTQDSFDGMVNDAEKSIAVLGNRNYVQPYRDGFKWNPADERLKFAWVSVAVKECEPYFEGKLFAWD